MIGRMPSNRAYGPMGRTDCNTTENANPDTLFFRSHEEHGSGIELFEYSRNGYIP